MSGKVATANRLREGDIVYLTRKGEWSSDLQEARVIEGDDSELVGWAEKAVKDRDVVDAYIIEVDCIDGKICARSQRERIRAAGPTV